MLNGTETWSLTIGFIEKLKVTKQYGENYSEGLIMR